MSWVEIANHLVLLEKLAAGRGVGDWGLPHRIQTKMVGHFYCLMNGVCFVSKFVL